LAKYDAHLDTTWGQFIYFQYGADLKWHKVKMYSSIEDDYKGNKFDVDPFGNCEITTNK